MNYILTDEDAAGIPWAFQRCGESKFQLPLPEETNSLGSLVHLSRSEAVSGTVNVAYPKKKR